MGKGLFVRLLVSNQDENQLEVCDLNLTSVLSPKMIVSLGVRLWDYE